MKILLENNNDLHVEYYVQKLCLHYTIYTSICMHIYTRQRSAMEISIV